MISNFDEITTPSFPLGTIVATAAANEIIPHIEMTKALERHSSGDWGDLCEEDKHTNEVALKNEGRLMSVYKSEEEIVFWIITEWDRSVTTILLPSDY